MKDKKIHGENNVWSIAPHIEKHSTISCCCWVCVKKYINWLWQTFFSMVWSCVEETGWSCLEKGIRF